MSELRVKIWVIKDGKEFGHGHIQIMQEIAKSKSILAASKALGLSYKKTWSKKELIGELLGKDAFLSQAGRSQSSGTKLSASASQIAECFMQLEDEIRVFAQDRFNELLKPLLERKDNEA